MRDGFQAQIRRNRRRLAFFLGALLLLAAGVGRVAGDAIEAEWDPEAHYGPEHGFPERAAEPWYARYPNHLAGAMVLLVLVQYLRMRRRGDRVLVHLVGAAPLEDVRAHNAAAEMALAAGIERPPLFVTEDPSRNAFACGAGRRHAIVVTRGLVEHLDRDALQAVVAHETAHIKNGDTALATMLYGMTLLFRMTASFALGPLASLWTIARTAPAQPAGPSPAGPSPAAASTRAASPHVRGHLEQPVDSRRVGEAPVHQHRNVCHINEVRTAKHIRVIDVVVHGIATTPLGRVTPEQPICRVVEEDHRTALISRKTNTLRRRLTKSRIVCPRDEVRRLQSTHIDVIDIQFVIWVWRGVGAQLL
jgi:hypothetical protein